jgi:hypothetical protein
MYKSINEVNDYSDSLITIYKNRKKAHEAILRKDWTAACDCFDVIILAADLGKLYCLQESAK